MDLHLLCGILLLIAAVFCYYKARKDGDLGDRNAWSAVMMVGLSLTQLLPLLPTSLLSSQLSESFVGFAYGVAMTAGVAAALAKPRLVSITDSKLLRDNKD